MSGFTEAHGIPASVQPNQKLNTTSVGAFGDRTGDVAMSSTHIYYCTGYYAGTTNIWKRISWSVDTW